MQAFTIVQDGLNDREDQCPDHRPRFNRGITSFATARLDASVLLQCCNGILAKPDLLEQRAMTTIVIFCAGDQANAAPSRQVHQNGRE